MSGRSQKGVVVYQSHAMRSAFVTTGRLRLNRSAPQGVAAARATLVVATLVPLPSDRSPLAVAVPFLERRLQPQLDQPQHVPRQHKSCRRLRLWRRPEILLLVNDVVVRKLGIMLVLEDADGPVRDV